MTELAKHHEQPEDEPITAMIRTNYLSSRGGARVLFATDEWFAAADNLLKDSPPVFDPNAFCIEGKVMDGWETRRKRKVGHDFVIVQLADAVKIEEIVIDTGYFTGNFVPAISIQAHSFSKMHEAVEFVQQLPGALSRIVNARPSIQYQGTAATVSEVAIAHAATADWETIVSPTPLRAGYEETRYHTLPISNTNTTSANTIRAYTHLRINSFPDGGIARIRVYGRAVELIHLPRCLNPPILPYAVPHGDTNEILLPSQSLLQKGSIELTLDGQGIDCSNQHYGSPVKLLQALYGKDMGDGWETARHLDRPPILKLGSMDDDLVDFGSLNDWCIISLGRPARSIHAVVVDTKHFRGNFPESVQIEGRYDNNKHTSSDDDEEWHVIVPRSRLAPDAEHLFSVNVDHPIRFIRITMFPDGGLSRVRVYGEPLEE